MEPKISGGKRSSCLRISELTNTKVEAYEELLKPHRAPLLKRSVALGKQFLPEFPDVTFEELALEISVCAIIVGLRGPKPGLC